MNIALILDRLEGVKRHGKQCTAKCPAHQDKTPSLSLRDVGATVLVYCFAGCSTEAVMASIGLTSKDLYADSGFSRHEKRRFYEEKRRANHRTTLLNERTILQIAKNDIQSGKPLNSIDEERVKQAHETIIRISGGSHE